MDEYAKLDEGGTANGRVVHDNDATIRAAL